LFALKNDSPEASESYTLDLSQLMPPLSAIYQPSRDPASNSDPEPVEA
jgi:hypothetical protein